MATLTNRITNLEQEAGLAREAEYQTLKHKWLWPDVLLKACDDTFDYRLRLRTGEQIHFSNAEIVNHEWVRLKCDNDVIHSLAHNGMGEDLSFHYFGRGLEVRVADIVWIADMGD